MAQLHFDPNTTLFVVPHAWYETSMAGADLVSFTCDVENRRINTGTCPAGVILGISATTYLPLLQHMGLSDDDVTKRNMWLITYNDIHTRKTEAVAVRYETAQVCSPFLKTLAFQELDFDMFLEMIEL